MPLFSVSDWVCLYGPLCVSLFLLWTNRIYPRLYVAMAFATLWHLATLPWLNLVAEKLGFWSFQGGHTFVSMPLHYYLGWVLWWGVVATLMLGKLPTKNARCWVISVFLVFDLVAMPLFQPNLILSRDWVWGEILLIVFGLMPGLWLAHWTLSWTNLCLRAFLIAISFGFISLTLTPFMAGINLTELLTRLENLEKWQHLAYLGGFLILTSPAVAGIIAFAKNGKGTPIPFDPPKRLVTTGVYSYCSNPIQLSIVLSLILWGFYLAQPLFWLLAGISISYCLGIAHWSEHKDMLNRFGSDWTTYKKQSVAWRFRIEPYFPNQSAKIYIALDCGPCSEIAQWIYSKQPYKLEIHDASSWQGKLPLKRLTYQYPDGETEQGVLAITAMLQHLHIGWAMLAWIISYPGISHLCQLSLDASGGSQRLDKAVQKNRD